MQRCFDGGGRRGTCAPMRRGRDRALRLSLDRPRQRPRRRPGVDAPLLCPPSRARRGGSGSGRAAPFPREPASGARRLGARRRSARALQRLPARPISPAASVLSTWETQEEADGITRLTVTTSSGCAEDRGAGRRCDPFGAGRGRLELDPQRPEDAARDQQAAQGLSGHGGRAEARANPVTKGTPNWESDPSSCRGDRSVGRAWIVEHGEEGQLHAVRRPQAHVPVQPRRHDRPGDELGAAGDKVRGRPFGVSDL